MLGAVIGDVVGSCFETQTFIDVPGDLLSRDSGMTDDSVCTCAVVEALISGKSFHEACQAWVLRHPTLEYGGRFKSWALSVETVSDSYGNGGAMRVSPVALLGTSLADVSHKARELTSTSHNHPDAIAAAVVLAECIYMALSGCSKEKILKRVMAEGFVIGTVEENRRRAVFTTDARSTIGPALCAALSATSFVEAMQNGIRIGGDTDTICCMAGGLAEALYRIPESLSRAVQNHVSEDVWETMTALYRHASIPTVGLLCGEQVQGDENRSASRKSSELKFSTWLRESVGRLLKERQ